jgi:hypothetical protein
VLSLVLSAIREHFPALDPEALPMQAPPHHTLPARPQAIPLYEASEMSGAR